MWRNAGITYIRYSQIAADLTRKVTKTKKPAFVSDTKLTVTRWENGKPIKKDQ